ncbi:MAG: ChbG/HpnK family deacetylase [Hyphomicrobiaceae bacterium]|nr:ChbG/HpnK family deacetylase [Hyphomicrobiaceae bacterium]
MLPILQAPILNADDYAITSEVSRGIEELARAGRLSATSIMTNMPPFPALASNAKALRAHIAIGLHLNLTCGPSLVSNEHLAPAGRFRSRNSFLTTLITLDEEVLRAEIRAQLDHFEDVLNCQPDHIDGHQHMHVLPKVRGALLKEISTRRWPLPPLIRVPVSVGFDRKSAAVRAAAVGFARACRSAGLPTNHNFAGFSQFDRTQSYANEIEQELTSVGDTTGLSIVMCHPGYPDDELHQLDAVTDRRRDELDALMTLPNLPARIWHPDRESSGMIDWKKRASERT